QKLPPRSPHTSLFTPTPPTAIYTLSLHDALPISAPAPGRLRPGAGQPVPRLRAAAHGADGPAGPRHRPPPDHRRPPPGDGARRRSEEHTSELQSRENLVCRLLLEKKKPI